MKSPKELVQIARSLAYTRICTHLINLRYTEIRDLKKEMKSIEKEAKHIKITINFSHTTKIKELMRTYKQCLDAIEKLKDEINLINQDKFPFKEDEDKFLQISENILTEMIKQQALIESI